MRTANPAKRQRIIDSAARLFAERHYHEVRMDDIAAQAGVAKGTLYLHFKHKEDLYLALILSGTRRIFELVEGKLAEVHSAEEKLLVLIREFVHFYRRYPYFLELIQRVDLTPAADGVSPLEESRVQFLDVMTDIFRELNATGRFAVDDPKLAALALRGMTREILRFQPRPWPDHLAEWIVRQFLHGIRS